MGNSQLVVHALKSYKSPVGRAVASSGKVAAAVSCLAQLSRSALGRLLPDLWVAAATNDTAALLWCK